MPDIFPRIAQGPTHTAGPDRLLLHYRDHSGQSAQLCPFSSKFQFNFFLFIPTKSFMAIHKHLPQGRGRCLPGATVAFPLFSRIAQCHPFSSQEHF